MYPDRISQQISAVGETEDDRRNAIKPARSTGVRCMIGFLLRFFALASILLATGVVVVEARTGVYRSIAERIWANHSYPPAVILNALHETSAIPPTLACASGTTVDRAAIALRALDNALLGHGELTLDAALPLAMQAIDEGLACRPLAAQLWLGRFWVRATAEGYRPELRESFDRAIATAPYDGWMMRLRTQIGSRWFYALSNEQRHKFFEDLRYTVDMGFLDEALAAAERLGNQNDLLKQEIDKWPIDTRDRLAGFLLANGIDLKLATDFKLKPWQHY
jgi:hypothetical protein